MNRYPILHPRADGSYRVVATKPKTLALTWADPHQKIAAIKALRLVSRLYGDTLGLKEAKDAVDAAAAGQRANLYTGDAKTVEACVAAFGAFVEVVTADAAEPTVTVTLTRAQAEAMRKYAWDVYVLTNDDGAHYDGGTRDLIDRAGEVIDDALAGRP